MAEVQAKNKHPNKKEPNEFHAPDDCPGRSSRHEALDQVCRVNGDLFTHMCCPWWYYKTQST